MKVTSRLLLQGGLLSQRVLKRRIYNASLVRKGWFSSRTQADSTEHLRRVFDDQGYFDNFTKTATSDEAIGSLFRTSSVGLFKNSALNSPEGLVKFSEESLVRAKSLVSSMMAQAKNSEEGKLEYIRKLDQLSDVLCRVIDVAEFIRVTHSSQKWTDAAQQTHEIMFEYMNQLNTNVELYQILRDLLENPGLKEKLTKEEIEVGEYLKQDFERSGIDMDPNTRNNFVAITQEISLLGSQFNNNIHNLESYWCEISKSEFESITDSALKSEIFSYQSASPASEKKNPTSIFIPLSGHIPYSLLSKCTVESVRRRVWIALHNSPKEQIDTLNAFLKYRAVLAKMLGYSSFAHYQLEHKMAKNPENVMTLLKNLQQGLISKKDGVCEEVRRLHSFKDKKYGEMSNEDILDDVKPWDREILLSKLQAQNLKDEEHLDDISEYLSIGTIVSGLSRLFNSIYNVTLIPEATLKGETWDLNQVRKLNVFDLTTKKTLGYLYLDFWSPKVLPSHFTIVCLRKLNDDIKTESKEDMRELVQLDENEEYQLPVISLVCNFQKPHGTGIGRFTGMDSRRPTLLSLDQVDTIFHEMGHAMHSMIGKTNLHNLSGTRCMTDFVELPSVLMESFSKDPRVLCKIAKHYRTKEPLSEETLAKHQSHRVLLEESETFMQSKMAMLDQVLHSEEIINGGINDFDSTVFYHNLESNLKVFADKWSTWHGKFPHLFSYGAVYYSYLLDRAIAEKIWHGLFKNDPWSRQAGEKYKDSILKWGGTRDPWLCLADALADERLSKGDSKAMEIIGQKV